MKNTRHFILIALLIVILAMAFGYAAFATQLNINGTAEIVGDWNVKIVNIEAQNVSDGCDYGAPQYTDTTATFDAKLVNPGDSITYVITIENAGTIDAKLDNIICTDQEDGSDAISYITTEPATSLKAGEQTTFTIEVVYDSNYIGTPSVKTKTVTGIIEYVQEA